MPLVRKIRCAVQNIVDHGNQVYTIDLAPEKEAPAFRPGQFLHLAIDDYDPSGFWPESRAFSIASSPAQRSQLRISYSVKGKYTAYMEKQLAVGKQVWVKLPYGEFVIDDREDVVLIAGGTGITAFSAFIEALNADTQRKIYLFYGARNESLLIYAQMLAKIAQSVPNFQLHYALETAPTCAALAGFAIHPGQLAIDWIWKALPCPVQVVYFLSGPPPMLKRFGNDLRAREVAEPRIRIDAWE